MLNGLPVIYGINPYNTETVPSHPLGAVGFDAAGRKFRYGQVGSSTALVAGETAQGVAQDTGEQSILMAAAAVGATSVTTADTVTVTANQYADGYLIGTGEGGTGNGIMYRIKSHPAVTAGTLTVQLYEPIKVAFSSATQVDFVPSAYKGLVVAPTTASGSVVGVAVVAAPASSYTWIQSGGPGVCFADASGAVTVGATVTASNQTAGCVEDGDTDTQQIIGVAMTGIAQAECGAVFLTID